MKLKPHLGKGKERKSNMNVYYVNMGYLGPVYRLL
jgi:hypothetical protein